MSDNGNEPTKQPIFQASLIKKDDGKFEYSVEVFASHLPSLAHALKILQLRIDRMYIETMMSGQAGNIKPAGGSIINFVRGRR